MAEKEKDYACAYKHCLHEGERVKSSESVIINKKHYHWDCAVLKNRVDECVNTYMDYIEDKSQYPLACRVINTLIFNNNVPIDFVLQKIIACKDYYMTRPPLALYGIKKLFWEIEYTRGSHKC